MQVLVIIFFIFLCSCGRDILSVYSDYVSYQDLASYHVNTPDPLRSCPPFGQRLIVNWALPRKDLNSEEFSLRITIRFRNREEIVRCLSLRHAIGTYIFPLLNAHYMEKGGILTYKVQLLRDGELVKEKRHQLWAELITFENNLDTISG